MVIGSGPNGLAAAIALARAGRRVVVFEAEDQIGGGTRSAELTLPGFLHDVCSAVHPMAVASPFLRTLPLAEHGLEWIYPELPLAHPFDDGSAVVLHHSLDETCRDLGPDGEAYRRLIGPTVSNWARLEELIFGPIHLPAHPFALARFGLQAIRPAASLAKSTLKSEPARALWAGLAAHSVLPLDAWGTSAFALVLAAVAHVQGWPVAKGGSQRIADALAAHLRSLGGQIVTGTRIQSLKDLPAARTVLCDLSPHALARMAGESLPAGYRRSLTKFQPAPGVFKVDWALRAPIPWKSPLCGKAGTVHVGGALAEVSQSEQDCWRNIVTERPFLILTQPSLFDPSRAPTGRHTAWAYCHVPNGCTRDMTERIEAQVERFAPGFRQSILARSSRSPAMLERENANLIGGDITGGAYSLRQLFLRPTWRLYSTPNEKLFLCSSSTPPGGGVHGMCGYHAARRVLAADGRPR